MVGPRLWSNEAVIIRRCLIVWTTVLLVAAGCTNSHRGTDPEADSRSSTTTYPSSASLTRFVAFDMTWVNDTQGWALGALSSGCAGRACASVLHTVDGGKNWVRLPAPQASIPFFDNSAAGAPVCTAAVACVQGIRFANPDIGYLYGKNSLWLTTNGGRSWSERSTDDTDALEVDGSQVVRVVEPTEFCTGGCSLQVEAAKVGTTLWRSFRVPAFAGFGEALAVDGLNLYVETVEDGAPSQFFVSHDFGADWSLLTDPCRTMPGGEDADAGAISAGPAGHLVVACTAGKVGRPDFTIVSSNAATTFAPPGGAPLGAATVASDHEQIIDIAAATARRLALVATAGTSAYICISNDSGAHWTVTETDNSILENGPNHFYLGFVDAMTGQAILNASSLSTTDGGGRWSAFTYQR